MYFDISLIAFILDKFFGEFEKLKFIKHPIIIIGDYIKWFNNKFYKDSIFRGFLLSFSLLFIVFIVTSILSLIDNILIQGFLCSFALSSKMLYERVKEVIVSKDPKFAISMLVSRDTQK